MSKILIKKVVKFGKVNYNNTGKRYPAEVEIELRENEEGMKVFSVCGTTWNTAHTDCVCGGQCLDTMKKFIKSKKYETIYTLWKKYHLNDMHAGTERQEKTIEDWKSRGNTYEYTKVCDYLKSIGLYEDIYNGKPHRYGCGWTYRELPENIENIINEL